MTVPRPPESPQSRRAARAQREEAVQRAAAPAVSVIEGPRTLPLPIIPQAPAAGEPVLPVTRHDARAEDLLTAEITPPRHVQPPRAKRAAVAVTIAAAGALLLGSSAAMTAMMSDHDSGAPASIAKLAAPPLPSATQLPVPQIEQAAATANICQLPDVIDALSARDDEGVVTGAGGGEAFREAVIGGHAPCISLSDPVWTWVVVNKTRPFAPIDYRPGTLVLPDGVRSLEGGFLRSDAASALTKMVAAAKTAGVGEIAMESGFRSYTTQHSSYGNQVGQRGIAGADLVSARPGYSEHQSGLAADLVACNGGCGTLDQLHATPQGKWLKAHAWQFGFIVRYEAGHTDTTGYLAEPWHVRYIGAQLAQAYHAGGWHSLEDFFALPKAPGYIG